MSDAQVLFAIFDCSPDAKLVFLHDSELSLKINLTEFVQPFCKN
ncbi:MAG: hypothetical protein WB586_20070 [Chthoniobacterales bacterium]